MEGPTTERLWLSEPRRKTSIGTVTAVRGEAFQLDRSLFAPKSRTYRHPQQADHGTVWTADGEKRRLVTVFERDGGLWHRLRGATPRVGDPIRCHLDVERREETERAHTAMHLVLHTWPHEAGQLAADPEVRGGGHFRLTCTAHWIAPPVLSSWREAALRLVQQDRPITRTHVSDEVLAHRVTPQPFADGARFPGPETTRECIAIDRVGVLPCDGTHLGRTSGVGGLVVQKAHPDREGRMVLVWRSVG